MPCSGQATTPAAIAIRQTTRPLQLVELAQQPLRHLHAFDGAQVRRQHADRVLLEAEGFVDDADAVTQGDADDRHHRLAPSPTVALAQVGAGGVEDRQRERVPVAAVGLDQLFEPPPHLPRAVEAGQFRLFVDRHRLCLGRVGKPL